VGLTLAGDDDVPTLFVRAGTHSLWDVDVPMTRVGLTLAGDDDVPTVFVRAGTHS
jgi:hypothetical protein